MKRRFFIGLALATTGYGFSAEPVATSKNAPRVPLEFVLVGKEQPSLIEVRAEVGGVSLSQIWDETFAKLFAFVDRNSDGVLDSKEVANLPSPRALRQAMGNGFAPPSGESPAFKELDRNGDGKVSPAELAEFYRANGIGNALVGVGRLPFSADLTAALLKQLDTNGDGKVSESEWRGIVESLKKLDKNDDELIGVGELVPKAVYPGASGSTLMSPAKSDVPVPEILTKFPLVQLPVDRKDADWANARRNRKADAHWEVNFAEKPAEQRFAFANDRYRLEGWIAAGKAENALATVRKQIVSQFEALDPEAGAEGGLAWLIPIADRDGNGKLDRKEIDAWLDLQTQITRGQVLLTILEGGGFFELLDRNHDGALSIRELRDAINVIKAAGCLSDGFFDPKKVPTVLLIAASRGYPQSLAIDSRLGPAWFRAMDRNGDGDVSRREFTGPVELFDKLDLNKDGLLDVEEAGKSVIKN